MNQIDTHSPSFDAECVASGKRRPQFYRSDSDYSNRSSVREDDSSSSSNPYDVSKLEAYFYYFGIRGYRHRGPKLIFRTSKDVFTAPLCDHDDFRLMQ
ncbi:hypothetical protein CPB85DRAFT_1288523, partial [Mucidula mucida]